MSGTQRHHAATSPGSSPHEGSDPSMPSKTPARETFDITGMTCAACQARVQKVAGAALNRDTYGQSWPGHDRPCEPKG